MSQKQSKVGIRSSSNAADDPPPNGAEQVVGGNGMKQGSKSGNQRRGRPFQPGVSGNPGGRPIGSRNKATLEAQFLLDQHSSELIQKAIERALEGDPLALRLCIERLLPRRREATVSLDLPKVENTEDCRGAIAKIIEAATTGEIALSQARTLADLVETQHRNIDISGLERRLEDLEEARKNEG